MVTRDLGDAKISALSADRRFATAYNAALQSAKMAIACAGYRVTGTGAHQISFEAAVLAMGQGVATLTAYFETCRRKRNTLDYDTADIISETEADELVQKADEFHREVEAWIATDHPQFVP